MNVIALKNKMSTGSISCIHPLNHCHSRQFKVNEQKWCRKGELVLSTACVWYFVNADLSEQVLSGTMMEQAEMNV